MPRLRPKLAGLQVRHSSCWSRICDALMKAVLCLFLSVLVVYRRQPDWMRTSCPIFSLDKVFDADRVRPCRRSIS